MLFNSVIFIVVFLPLCLLGWYSLQKLENPGYAKAFLVGMSLWFYGYYNPKYLLILLVSLVFNYLCSIWFEKCNEQRIRKTILILGILFNVGLIFYFKYYNFFIDNCNFLLHTDWNIERIALPLGISFFTFQQLSFVVDRYMKTAPHYEVLDYACFVTYFPQLIAGPIVLHSEYIPQLQKRENRKVNWDSFYDGIMLFTMGFGKKVLLADVLAVVVNPEFNNIDYLDLPAAWIVLTCYTFELYFDFSGYCDMARGIGKMFGFELPLNFNSPLMATSIKDFWRRWHMTLSRFLTTYIFFPLGGSRKGKFIKLRNLMIVFLVSGIWHGANWTYIVWGVSMGSIIVIENLLPNLRFKSECLNRWCTRIIFMMTLVIFRCDSLKSAGLFFRKLFAGGFHGSVAGVSSQFQIPELYVAREILERIAPNLLSPLFAVSLLGTLAISAFLVRGKLAETWIEDNGRTWKGLLITVTIFVWSFISLSQVSTFLYFNF